MSIFEQTHRASHQAHSDPDFPKSDKTVCIVELTPMRADGTEIRSLTHSAKVGALLAALPGVVQTAWSRTEIHSVLDVADVPAAVLMIEAALAEAGLASPKFRRQVTEDPSEFDWSFRSSEVFSRHLLVSTGRHQCQGRSFCMCAFAGNKWANTPANRRGERGSMLGAELTA